MNFETVCFYVVTITVLLAVSRIIAGRLLKTNLTRALVESDNKALGIELGGYYLAVFIILGGTLAGPGYDDLWSNFLWSFAYGTGGLILLNLSAVCSSQLLLKGNQDRAIEEGNSSVGLVTASIRISLGIIISAAITGEIAGSRISTLIFFALGWAVFLIFVALYRALTDYDDYREIFSGNLAASISYSANMIAISLIIAHSVSDNSEDIVSSLIVFGKSLTAVASLYFVRQFLVQGLLLGSGFNLYGGRLDREIAGDRNTAAAAIEAAAFLGAALLAVKLI